MRVPTNALCLLLLLACHGTAKERRPNLSRPTTKTSTLAQEQKAQAQPTPIDTEATEAAPSPSGINITKIKAPISPNGVGDGIITVVRVDPERFEFRFYTEAEYGTRQPMPRWLKQHGLTGGINLGMFMPDGRSVGYLQQDGEVLSKRKPKIFESVLAFEETGLIIGGKGCKGVLESFIKKHKRVLQARRNLVDCKGKARDWKNGKRYSAAAIGVDDRGWIVLVHSRTPYRMTTLSKILAKQEKLRGLVYMEGGPEASLVVPPLKVSQVGSYEDGFNPNDDNREFWDLPNIIGFRAKRPTE